MLSFTVKATFDQIDWPVNQLKFFIDLRQNNQLMVSKSSNTIYIAKVNPEHGNKALVGPKI